MGANLSKKHSTLPETQYRAVVEFTYNFPSCVQEIIASYLPSFQRLLSPLDCEANRSLLKEGNISGTTLNHLNENRPLTALASLKASGGEYESQCWLTLVNGLSKCKQPTSIVTLYSLYTEWYPEGSFAETYWNILKSLPFRREMIQVFNYTDIMFAIRNGILSNLHVSRPKEVELADTLSR